MYLKVLFKIKEVLVYRIYYQGFIFAVRGDCIIILIILIFRKSDFGKTAFSVWPATEWNLIPGSSTF